MWGTIQRVFAVIRSDELQEMLKGILVQMIEMAGAHLDQYLYQNEELGCYVQDIIAADGKETHRTAKKHAKDPEDSRNLNEFNVMSTEWGVCLSSTRINEKTNEIPEMQAVMKGIDCRKCIVTADAMNAQKETARVIVQEARGDYCLALKGNQKQAYEEVRNYFACTDLLKNVRRKAGQYQSETEGVTYTVTTREYFITDDIQWFEDRSKWEKLRSIWYERKTVTVKETGESHIEERYYLCSIKPIAELFAITVRRNWNIENSLHWTLDVVFREDSLGSKEKKAVHNLGLIRRFVLWMESFGNAAGLMIDSPVSRQKCFGVSLWQYRKTPYAFQKPGPLSVYSGGFFCLPPDPRGLAPRFSGNRLVLAYVLTRNDNRIPRFAVLIPGIYTRFENDSCKAG